MKNKKRTLKTQAPKSVTGWIFMMKYDFRAEGYLRSNVFRFIFICFLISLTLSSFSQQNKIDSLLTLLKTDKEDTAKITHLNLLANEFSKSNYDTAIVLATQALTLSENISKNTNEGSDVWVAAQIGRGDSYLQIGAVCNTKGDYTLALEKYFKGIEIMEVLNQKIFQTKKLRIKKLESEFVGNIGSVYWNQGDNPKALDYYFKALKIAEDLGDKSGIGRQLGNIGLVYKDQGDYPKSLDCFLKALKIAEEMGNKNEMGRHLGNIGIFYRSQSNYPKALDYYFKALEMAEEIGDKIGIGRHLGNIGNVYADQGDYSKALDYYFKALKIAEELGNKRSIGFHLGNIGFAYKNQGDFPKALDYSFKALKIAEELGNKSGIGLYLGNIGLVYTSLSKYKEAESYLLKAIALCDSVGHLDHKKEFEKSISDLYDTTGRYQLAYQHYKIYSQLNDSLFSIEKTKDLTRKEMNYEFEKKEAATKAEHEKQMAVAEVDRKRKRIIIGAIISGLLLLSIIIVIVIRSIQITRKRKAIIEQQKEVVDGQRKVMEEQKHIVEEKQKEIVDSIHYAKHIQHAVLKGDGYIKNCLPGEYFILYKPKDIVSGDFYWFSRQKGHILIAVADCTGHGVSGGFMTMLGNSFLNEIVEKKGLINPAEILTEMHKAVLTSLHQTGVDSEVQDGMEMALCSIDIKNKTLEFAGAMNSIYLMQNNELKEIEGDYYSIGGKSLFGGDNKTRFTNKVFILEKDTILYLFTDGYTDQFGGEKKEKFNIPKFKKLLSSMNSESMMTQQQKLNEALNNWMKPGYAQVDDILVMGIRI